ncbi:transglycosylase domain-containing protein [Candidatus Uhrbacteria bacterium]|nr:transglycosylase domain-containing protein [Candidatus Uhrbacteria bacterium]
MPSLPSRHHSWKHLRRHSLLARLPKGAVKNGILVLVALGLGGSIALLAFTAYVSRDLPDPNSLSERTIIQSTKIYDRTGQHLLYEIHGDENRTLVKLAEGFCQEEGEALETDPGGIPLFAVQATIAAEDRRFCQHHGFSVKGILRAVFDNLRGNRYGGSTLTQQLVKQAILSSEKNLTRKLKELVLSIEIERRYSKDQILQIYFNEIPYGSTNYGIQAASQSYFKKDVKDLTLAEAATLAALPQRPTTLLNNPDILKARRDWILESMAELGFVVKDQVEATKAEEVAIEPKLTNITAPHFVFYVKQLLEEQYGYSQREVEEGGLKVITTLDLDKQKIAEEEVKRVVEEKGERYKFNNGGLVALDPKTGQILSMVGSKDYWDDTIQGQVNVTLRPLQPGSSFKPIVYTVGFLKGYTPNTLLWDSKTEFPTSTGPYAPANYSGNERGPLTVRTALQGSLNIPAVKMMYLVGVENVLQFAERLGYTTFTDRSRFGLAVVLGGGEVKLLEHAGAYGAFANDGVLQKPVAILRVEDAQGNALEEWKPSEGTRALDANAARMITNVLSDNAARAYVFGMNSLVQLGERPVAAKTGTTQKFKDAEIVGYTPSLVAGVWVGNTDGTVMAAGADGSVVAAPIWNAFMRRALEGQPIEQFTPPEIPQRGKAVLDGRLAKQTVTVDTASGKLTTEYTPSAYREERTYAKYHDILHYVRRDDPLGSPPENPAEDPHYAAWEAGVRAWIAREEERTGVKLETGSPPTEYDDVHVPTNFPSVSIEYPSDGAELSSRDLQVSVNASAARGVARVEFYLDGYYLGNDASEPFELWTTIPSAIGRGYHTLKTVASDDAGNAGSDSVGIRLESDGVLDQFSIMDPKNGQTIERTQSVFTVVLTIEYPSDYASVRVYAEKIGGGIRSLVGSISAPTSPFLTVSWTLPEDGDWILTAEAERNGGGYANTPGTVVHLVTPASAKKEETTSPPPSSADGTTVVPENSLNPLLTL